MRNNNKLYKMYIPKYIVLILKNQKNVVVFTSVVTYVYSREKKFLVKNVINYCQIKIILYTYYIKTIEIKYLL